MLILVTLMTLVGFLPAPAPAASSATLSGKVVPDARKVVGKFVQPGADLARLTADLKPSPADVRAVFDEPLATRLVALYARLFRSGAAIGPKPGQSTYRVWQTTTGKLRPGHPALGQFPGGFRKVSRFLIRDVPVARFKFVAPGKQLGMAFAALFYVNGHWVFMPKPWRGLQ